MENKAYSPRADGLRLAVRLTPRAKRDGVEGVMAEADGRAVLRIRLAAPPVEGAANAALIAFLAEALGLRKAAITIRSGEAARHKILHLSGEPALLQIRLEAWLAAAGG